MPRKSGIYSVFLATCPARRKRQIYKNIYENTQKEDIRDNIKWRRGFDQKYGRIIIVKRWKIFLYNNNSQNMYLFMKEIHGRIVVSSLKSLIESVVRLLDSKCVYYAKKIENMYIVYTYIILVRLTGFFKIHLTLYDIIWVINSYEWNSVRNIS